ncbi:efflux transporter outer membrane subunit [Sphingomonas sp. MMS24-J13]|uniref:efflux transporter outer membrane subunit n=1 Tax=Sphingomonas sp. MMS24-J13 TaxID=3238686 RepID=UPI0038500C1F
MPKTRLALVVTALLGGCAVGPDYRPPQTASLNVPAAYSVETVPAAPVDLSLWWRQFNDPLLTDLIGRATAANLDIAVSQGRLIQARESLIQASASLFPSLTGSAGVTHNMVYSPLTSTNVGGTVVQTGGNSATTQLSLGLDASWQVDIFGGTRRSIEAARANADNAAFNLAAIRTSVAGEVATNYITARLAQARLAIARDTLKTQDDNLEIAGWRVKAGLVSSVDVEQARAQRAQTAASIPLFQNSLVNATSRLGVLTGQAPGSLRQTIAALGPIPHGPDGVAVGIPADTLRQRPDVRAAERSLASATAQIGVAKAQLYPALNITGSLSTAASRVGSLTDIVTGALFAGLTQTIFDAGRLRSQARSARAGADIAFATYKQTVLSGLEDVENATQALNAARERQTQLAIAVDASNNAAILARSQYRAGLTDFLTLLQSEQTLLSARDALASAESDQALALVQLYLALGGGWQPASPETNGSPS